MDQAEAVAQLKAAQELAERLHDVAQTMKAQGLKPHEDTVQKLIASLDPAQQGKHEAPVNGQEAKKADDQGHLTDPVERPARPTITLDTPSAFAAISEGPIASFAGEDSAWVAHGDWHDTAAHTASIVAGQTASWYAHAGGIQAKAANGPVSLRAHTDRLEILADGDMQVASVNGEITIQAKSRIELVGGDSSVVLDGQNITFTTPGTFTVKAATHAWEGAGSAVADLAPLPSGACTPPSLETPLQTVYTEFVDYTEFPGAWLPFSTGKVARAVVERSAIATLSASGNTFASEPVVTRSVQEISYWHSTGSAAWRVEEEIEAPGEDLPELSTDQIDDDLNG
jgi:type VI secretion system secreted protein VgrG